MKLSKLFVIALLAGTLGVFGCGSDSSSNGGNGDTPDPSVKCNEGLCVENSTLRAQCQTGVETCIANEPEVNWDECILGIVGGICRAQ
jgi:hypothetical protein